MTDNSETYPCIVPNCTNTITFTKRDEEFYLRKGFTNAQGQVTKPRKCKQHRVEAKQAKQTYQEREDRFRR